MSGQNIGTDLIDFQIVSPRQVASAIGHPLLTSWKVNSWTEASTLNTSVIFKIPSISMLLTVADLIID